MISSYVLMRQQKRLPCLKRQWTHLETHTLQDNLQEVAVKVLVNCEKRSKCLARSSITDNVANITKTRRNIKDSNPKTHKIQRCSSFDTHLRQRLQCSRRKGEQRWNWKDTSAITTLQPLLWRKWAKRALSQEMQWNLVMFHFEHYIKNWFVWLWFRGRGDQ